MRVSFAIALLILGLTASAADKQLPLHRTSDDKVEIQADLLLDREQIRQAIGPNIAGSDLNGNFIALQVTVRPVSDTPVKIWRDDFTVICDKDGQRSTPFSATQIAGSATMVVKSKYGDTVGTKTDRVPVWSAGPIMGGVGNSANQQTAEVELKDDTKKTDSPLLAALRERILPEKTTTEPVSGLLFFSIDGKFKAKNLELFYKTENGRLGMRFGDK